MTREQLKKMAGHGLRKLAREHGLDVSGMDFRSATDRKTVAEALAAKLGLPKPHRSAWQPGDEVLS